MNEIFLKKGPKIQFLQYKKSTKVKHAGTCGFSDTERDVDRC